MSIYSDMKYVNDENEMRFLRSALEMENRRERDLYREARAWGFNPEKSPYEDDDEYDDDEDEEYE